MTAVRYLITTCLLFRESAATLEAESGYALETSDVSKFRQYILEASWSEAESAVDQLIPDDDEALAVGLLPFVDRQRLTH